VILDFSFQQMMRLSNIKRWGIVEMSRPQSVAEHSYNVAIIASAICDRIDLSPEYKNAVVNWALTHDLPEVVTGDVPSPLKRFSPITFNDLESEMFPLYRASKEKHQGMAAMIVKVADYIDAIQFAQKFCVDTRKDGIISEMIAYLDNAIKVTEDALGKYNQLVDDSWLNVKID